MKKCSKCQLEKPLSEHQQELIVLTERHRTCPHRTSLKRLDILYIHYNSTYLFFYLGHQNEARNTAKNKGRN